MKKFLISFIACAAILLNAAAEAYFPPPAPEEWETKKPKELGFNTELLQKAVDFAIGHETIFGKDPLPLMKLHNAREPFGEIVGPVKERGGQNGILLRDGFIVAEWGDTERVDMTFSVTKSYLSTMAGLALDDGLIKDVHDPVKNYVHDGGFDSEHNSKITWHMLLNQTSEWQGEMFGKPDWSDRYAGKKEPMREPGTHWRYNDVRVNRLSLSLLQVWKKPLPEALRERIMRPIGATDTWEWHGYENSWVEIDGQKMQSVSGGAHWGGGLWINTRDHARFTLLFLNNGNWNGKQLLSEDWVRRTRVPTPQNKTYGYMNWTPNTDQEKYPSAPENNVFAHGAGTNVLWIDPEHNIAGVVRWIQDGAIDEFIRMTLASIEK